MQISLTQTYTHTHCPPPANSDGCNPAPMPSLDPVTPADLPGHLEHTEHHSRVVLVGGAEARVKEDLLSPSEETEERDRVLDLLTGSGSHHSNLKVEGHTHTSN